MDRILKGILLSEQQDAIKRGVIQKIQQQASIAQPEQVVTGVLQECLDQILNSSIAFNVSACKEVYVTWARYNRETLERLWDTALVNQIFDGKYQNGPDAVSLLHETFRLLRSSLRFEQLSRIVEGRLISFVRENPGVDIIVPLSSFLLEFRGCIPKGEYTATFCVSMVHAVSTFGAPHGLSRLRQYIHDVSFIVGKLLQHIWYNSDSECVLHCLRTIFKVISFVDRNGLEPSNALGGIVQYIPTDMIAMVTNKTVSDTTILDTSITAALSRMIDWLSWPLAKNIDKWIVGFLQGLASVHKYTILIDVTESKVEQVYERLRYPVVRESALNVLAHMLLSFQHSPQPFHKIVNQVPIIVEVLRKEENDASRQVLRQMAELLHCLMHLHPGFPELYDPILEAIKDLPKPAPETIQVCLSQTKWTSQRPAGNYNLLSQFARKSETGKTGLVNLGNTCYMNSVLQAIFMCDSFRQEVLSSVVTPQQSVLCKLQQVFAFLSITQRAAYSPSEFLKVSRPVWFTAGQQQDCSEYLKYLLDQLHEEEKSVPKPLAPNQPTDASKAGPANEINHRRPTRIQRTFGGKMLTTYQCTKCGYKSSHTEEFTDLPLAFPNQSEDGELLQAGKLLIGGDNSQVTVSEGQDVMKPSVPTPSTSPDPRMEAASASEALPLDTMLDFYLKPEQLIGDNQYHCADCESLQDGERFLKITEAPEYLLLTLLRFSYNIKTQSRSKIFRDVKYPKVLQVPVYGKSEGNQTQSALKRSRPGPVSPSVSSDLKTSNVTYGLSAVIVHSGTSSECGHYYCYARHSIPVSQDDARSAASADEPVEDYLQERWYLFNDSRVSFSSYDSFSNVTKRFEKDTAYVLVYRRIHHTAVQHATLSRQESVHTGHMDPPLPPNLRELVERDNKQYLQEQELAGRTAALRQKNAAAGMGHNNFPRWDDSDGNGGPPGSCGGGGGMGGHDTSGSRFVF